jgi:hypothetical protein
MLSSSSLQTDWRGMGRLAPLAFYAYYGSKVVDSSIFHHLPSGHD